MPILHESTRRILKAALFVSVSFPAALSAAPLPGQELLITNLEPTWRDGSLTVSAQLKNISKAPLVIMPRVLVQAPGQEFENEGVLMLGAPMHIWTEERRAEETIVPNQEKTIRFDFMLSRHLRPGEYEVVFQVLDPAGAVMGGVAEKLKITGDGAFLDFSQERCKIVRVVNSEHVLFDPKEAPPFAAGISPEAVCTVKNISSRTIVAQLSFLVNEFAAFGYYLSSPEVVLGEIYSFAPREEREVSIVLPVKSKPQVYEAAAQFVNTDNPQDRFSAVVPLRWTIQGKAARISSWSVDKETYLAGGKSRIDLTVFYYASPDIFWEESPTRAEGEVTGTPLSDAELVIEARAVKGDKGVVCGGGRFPLASARTLDLQTKKVSIVTNGCASPELTVEIVSGGSILSTASISGMPLKVVRVEKRSEPMWIVFASLGVLLAAVLFIHKDIQIKHERA